MAHAAGDAHEFVIYGAHFRVSFPLLDADGDLVTGATTPDSEVSQDGGTFADASNEMTEIATSSGMYYLDLIGTETDCKQLCVICKSATAGMKTTPIVLYPNRLPILESGVAEAGASTTITLAAASASAKDDFYNGCYVFISDNDAAGSQYQVRKIVDYVGSTRVCTIDSAWGTNPSSSSNYDILVPPGMAVVQWAGGKIADPTNAGVPETDVTHWLGTAAATPTVAGVPEVDVTHFNGTAGTFSSGRPEVNASHISGSSTAADNAEIVFATDFATNYNTTTDQWNVNVENWNTTAVPAEHTAGYPIVTIKDGTGTGELNTASGAVASVNLVTSLDSGAITATSFGADAITASAIANGAIDAATFAADCKMIAAQKAGTVNDAGAAAGDFDGDSGLSATDDFYNGSVLAFTSGNLLGLARKITDYTGSSKNLVFATAFPAAPGNGDAFVILGRIE